VKDMGFIGRLIFGSPFRNRHVCHRP
jgi:hypothetical protein